MSGKQSMWFGGAMALAVLAATVVVGGATLIAKRAMAENGAEDRSMVVAQAAETFQLFKVISAKDEIIIGLSRDEAAALGAGPALDNLARRLADSGQVMVWQFTSEKATSGDLQLVALRRVAIMKSEAIRIEPYNAALKVVGPAT